MSKNRLTGLVMIACLVLVAGVPAKAASTGYTFPDGSPGFALSSQGGVVNPGVLVGFNPQPDPPGVSPFLSLADSFNPAVIDVPPGPCETAGACPGGGTYRFMMSFLGVGDSVIGDVPAPESGETSFRFISGSGDFAHHFLVTLNVSGPGDIVDWVAFNPQPDPPGDAFGVQFRFSPAVTALSSAGTVVADPQVSFSILEDGKPLEFRLAAVPEPPTWAMTLLGLAAIGVIGHRNRLRGPTLRQ